MLLSGRPVVFTGGGPAGAISGRPVSVQAAADGADGV
jgi:hypothetical protein